MRLRLCLAVLGLALGSGAGFDYRAFYHRSNDTTSAQKRLLQEGLQSLLCHAPPGPRGAVSDSACDFPTVNRANGQFFLPLFQELTHMTFFKYFRVNLEKGCPFWEDDGLCVLRDCSVCECEPKEVPKRWLEQDHSSDAATTPALAPLEVYGVPSAYAPEACDEQRRVQAWLDGDAAAVATEEALTGERLGRVDRSEMLNLLDDDWIDDEDLSDPRATYINLLDNPERFTGYGGESAHRIWYSIYDENCFEGADASPLNSQCLEKRVFYRIISGLQSSITTHIAQEYHNADTGEWGTNVDLLTRRVLKHDDRVENLYFLYLFLLRAITKASPALTSYDYTTGNVAADKRTAELVSELVAASDDAGAGAVPSQASGSVEGADVPRCCHGFDESRMFGGWSGGVEPDEKWWSEHSETVQLRAQLQLKFQNISRIMDCVGCEKCRLWGKLQIMGIGTAFKVLFADDPAAVELHRNEIIALINLAHQVAKSVAFVAHARDVEVQERIGRVVSDVDTPTLLTGAAAVTLVTALLWWRRRKRRRKKKSGSKKTA